MPQNKRAYDLRTLLTDAGASVAGPAMQYYGDKYIGRKLQGVSSRLDEAIKANSASEAAADAKLHALMEESRARGSAWATGMGPRPEHELGRSPEELAAREARDEVVREGGRIFNRAAKERKGHERTKAYLHGASYAADLLSPLADPHHSMLAPLTGALLGHLGADYLRNPYLGRAAGTMAGRTLIRGLDALKARADAARAAKEKTNASK